MVVLKRQRTGRRPRCWSSSGTHRRVWASPYTLLAALSLSLSLPPSPTRARFDLQTQFTDHTLFCLDSTRPALKAELDRSTKAVLGPSREIGAAPLSHCTALVGHTHLSASPTPVQCRSSCVLLLDPIRRAPSSRHTSTPAQHRSPSTAQKRREKSGEKARVVLVFRNAVPKKLPAWGFSRSQASAADPDQSQLLMNSMSTLISTVFL